MSYSQDAVFLTVLLMIKRIFNKHTMCQSRLLSPKHPFTPASASSVKLWLRATPAEYFGDKNSSYF